MLIYDSPETIGRMFYINSLLVWKINAAC